jgi:hypothetical protein
MRNVGWEGSESTYVGHHRNWKKSARILEGEPLGGEGWSGDLRTC